MHWADLSNEQFLAMVQGLTLTGPDVFSATTANNMLDSFILRSDLNTGSAFKFDQLI
jgi:hypothetical protein